MKLIVNNERIGKVIESEINILVKPIRAQAHKIKITVDNAIIIQI